MKSMSFKLNILRFLYYGFWNKDFIRSHSLIKKYFNFWEKITELYINLIQTLKKNRRMSCMFEL